MFPKVPLQGGLVALRGFVFLAWVPPGQLGRRVKWQLAPHDNFLIVRHPRQQVEHFVVGHTVRPDEPPAELDQAPQQQQHPDRDVVQHQGGGQQQRRRQPAQLGDGKVKGVFHAFP